jgi:hypothetical protein
MIYHGVVPGSDTRPPAFCLSWSCWKPPVNEKPRAAAVPSAMGRPACYFAAGHDFRVSCCRHRQPGPDRYAAGRSARANVPGLSRRPRAAGRHPRVAHCAPPSRAIPGPKIECKSHDTQARFRRGCQRWQFAARRLLGESAPLVPCRKGSPRVWTTGKDFQCHYRRNHETSRGSQLRTPPAARLANMNRTLSDHERSEHRGGTSVACPRIDDGMMGIVNVSRPRLIPITTVSYLEAIDFTGTDNIEG